MKKIFAISMVLMLAISIFGSVTPASAAICGTEFYYTLYAGQTIDAGTVTVSNDADNLYVTFTTSGDWSLDTTHLHVATTQEGVPAARNGNPIPGQFDYQTTHDPRVQTFTYTVAKSAIEGFNPGPGDSGSLVIAAHAALVRIVDGEVVQSETGWGDGTRFVDKGNWGTYIDYEWQTCNGGNTDWVKTGTAFAFGGGTNAADGDTTTCFLNFDLNNDGKRDFNRWGWSNGQFAPGTYEFDLYAGAGQCETSKGTLVGTVKVEYDGSIATVTYTMNDPYRLGQTHVYIGNEPMPQDNGDYTAAPGQYGNIHDDLNYVASDTFTIFGLSGEIYVVAHASVYEPAP